MYFGSLPGPEPSPGPRWPGTQAVERPQAVEHRTGPWTHFKHARSGLGEPGARAQSARDNDLDDVPVRARAESESLAACAAAVAAAAAAAGRTGSAYNLAIRARRQTWS